jgi:hypothetical protein
LIDASVWGWRARTLIHYRTLRLEFDELKMKSVLEVVPAKSREASNSPCGASEASHFTSSIAAVVMLSYHRFPILSRGLSTILLAFFENAACILN